MRPSRRTLALVCALLTATCTTDDPVQPDVDAPVAPGHRLRGGMRGVESSFSFLPPLVKRPHTSGAFDGDLLPEVDVCLLDESGEACATVQPDGLPSWPSGSVHVRGRKYQVSWDTGDTGWSLDPDRFYRITVRVSGVELGHIDLDPRDGRRGKRGRARHDHGRGDDPYTFRIGETIPIKFWIGTGALCDSGDPAVIECTEQAIIDEDGGTVRLTREGEILAVTIAPNSIPGGDPITLILERLDPDLLGEPCLPGLDAPQFGPCFRIRAEGLDGALTNPAVVSICSEIDGFDLPAGQDALQIHRYTDAGEIYGLANTPTMDCAEEMGLLRVPDSGPMRYAALGVNAVARFLGPRPLHAAHLGLGGLTSSFSRFRWALPGGMQVVDGDGLLLLEAAPGPIPATVEVLDEDGLAVAGATVHFETSDGTLSAPSAVTGADGRATVEWTLDGLPPGERTLTAYATGLWDVLPGHDSGFLVDRQELTLTATTCAGGFGTPTIDGSYDAGEWGCAHSVPLTVDVDGTPTPAEVHWMNDGTDLYFAVRVQDPTFDAMGNNIRVDFDNDGLGTRDPGDDAIGFEIGSGFIDEHLTAQCIAAAYFWCQSFGEASIDGAGAVGHDAVGHDGAWTVYELAHPLAGTPGEDIIRSAGQELGFFLTFRVGNDLNVSWWPDYGVFHTLTVAGY